MKEKEVKNVQINLIKIKRTFQRIKECITKTIFKYVGYEWM